LALALAFIARSLVPVGFMLSFEDGGLRLVACSGAVAVADAKAVPSSHHHNDGGSNKGDDDHAGAACPYAASNSLSFVHAPEISAKTSVIAAPFAHRPEARTVLLSTHANQSRAPPAFS